MIVWALVLLVVGLIMIIAGFFVAFGGGLFVSQSRLEEALVVILLPGGALVAVGAVIWLLVLLIMRWLA